MVKSLLQGHFRNLHVTLNHLGLDFKLRRRRRRRKMRGRKRRCV